MKNVKLVLDFPSMRTPEAKEAQAIKDARRKETQEARDTFLVEQLQIRESGHPIDRISGMPVKKDTEP